ncbi:hypothetical protein [Rummeliibacillus pycnus]|uniref:hypothetical protein n=1 Tax=Rummeliibacillus pycnus TaxID=101070 RepID=UPI000C9CB18B|nr:hypothetical protein [Rummeliibacillus pycnus]
MENTNKELPWYLKKSWSIFLAFICPPIAYLIILFNLEKMDHETKMDRLFFATIMTSMWLLKFLPHNPFTLFILIFCFAGSAFLLFYKFLAEK